MTNEAKLVRALNSAILELSQEFVAGTFEDKPLWAYESLFETYADHFKKMVSHESSMNVILDLVVAHLNIKWAGHRCYFIDEDGSIDWHSEQTEGGQGPNAIDPMVTSRPSDKWIVNKE